MADISQITLPNGSVYNLKDSNAREHSVELIMGTQSATTGSWTGVTTSPALYNGKRIVYFLPFAGSGNATLNLTLSGGTTTGAKPVYKYGTIYVTTQYPANSTLPLIWIASKEAWFLDSEKTNDNYWVYNASTDSIDLVFPS